MYVTDNKLKSDLSALLGDDIFHNGTLQKHIMAERIFKSTDILSKVEQIVHPAVINDFLKWKNHFEVLPADKRPPFVIMESAIILEKPNVLAVADKVLTVVAPLNIRLERIIRRDKCSSESAMQRVNTQWSDQKRMALSDFIIFADDKKSILRQLVEVYNSFTK